jgi:hypothetical protein
MNPITHFLASWTIGERSGLGRRDRAMITWAGFLPDLDGMGVVVDGFAKRLGYEDPVLYGRWHHVILHGLFGALLLSAVGAAFARRRIAVFLWAFVAVHIHLLCDLVGSRGPAWDDAWPVHYLGPFSEALSVVWSGQWPLNAWPNILFTALLILFVFHRAITRGRSPLDMINARANEAFVRTLRARWLLVRNFF